MSELEDFKTFINQGKIDYHHTMIKVMGNGLLVSFASIVAGLLQIKSGDKLSAMTGLFLALSIITSIVLLLSLVVNIMRLRKLIGY